MRSQSQIPVRFVHLHKPLTRPSYVGLHSNEAGSSPPYEQADK